MYKVNDESSLIVVISLTAEKQWILLKHYFIPFKNNKSGY